MRKLRDFN